MTSRSASPTRRKRAIAHAGEIDDRGEDVAGEERRVRRHDDRPESLVGADPLADDGADGARRRRQTEAREDERQSGRKLHLEEDLPPRGNKRIHQIEGFALDRRIARHRIDNEREEAEKRRDENLGKHAEAEPDDQNGRDRDDRDRLRGHHERQQAPAQHAGKEDRRAQGESGADAKGKADEHLLEGDPRVGQEGLRCLDDDDLEDLAERRQDVIRRAGDDDEQFPNRDTCADQQRRRPRSRERAA